MKFLVALVFMFLMIGCCLIASDLISNQQGASKPENTRRTDRTFATTPVTSDNQPPNKQNIDSPNVSAAPKTASRQPDPTGERNPDLLSRDEQIALGNEVARNEHLDDNTYIDPQIDRIARRLLSQLPARYAQSHWQWRIRCKRTPDHEINAISLPGGRIYVFDGIPALTRVDDELAAVLSHEIIHVAEQHCAEQLVTTGQIQRATDRIVHRVSEGNAQSTKGKIASIATALGTVLIQMHLTRSDEFEADERGFQLLMKAGYHPEKALGALEKIQQIEQSSGSKQGIIGRAFSSHPPTADRIANLREKLPTYTAHSIDKVN